MKARARSWLDTAWTSLTRDLWVSSWNHNSSEIWGSLCKDTGYRTINLTLEMLSMKSMILSIFHTDLVNLFHLEHLRLFQKQQFMKSEVRHPNKITSTSMLSSVVNLLLNSFRTYFHREFWVKDHLWSVIAAFQDLEEQEQPIYCRRQRNRLIKTLKGN